MKHGGIAMWDRPQEIASPTPRSRRSVVVGAAWTVPVVALAVPVPAFAASSCSVAPTIPAFPSGGVQSGNGWTIDATGSGGVVPSSGSLDFAFNGFRCTADAVNGQTVKRSAIYTLNDLSVLAERTYTFTVEINYYSLHPNTAFHTLSLGVGNYSSPTSPALTPIVTPFASTGVGAGGDTQYSVTYTPTTAGPLRIAFGFSVSSPASGATTGDDIRVKSVVASC